ncbi:MAG: hypothetical protein LH618_17895 [Saprospiraceae bacterium]|nr:hypothetical protein [Saprospiraceae bacterium]
MRKNIITVLLLVFTAISASAQYKVDTMCGAKVILGQDGQLLSRYEPQTPGAGYVKAVALAVHFWKNCPTSPTNNLPLYLTHCSMYRDGKGGFVGSNWPHNPIVVNAGIVQGLAIDWRNFSGDETMLSLARQGLDHQLKYGTTPADWDWAAVPYASSEAGEIMYDGASMFDTAVTEENIGRGDGSYVLEADKIGDMGMAYLKFYQITEETKYLDAAIQCADALAKHVRRGLHGKDGLDWKKHILTSPWPFRVKAESGAIVEDYTAHVVDNLRLIEELMRIKERIHLSSEQQQAYQKAADIVWDWLYSAEGAIKTSIWKGYFEDIPIDQINLNRVNNSPMEFARYLIRHPHHDPVIGTAVPGLIWWVKNTWFKEEAFRYFNHATYMAEPGGVVQVGHTWWGEIWFSDGYSDYIRHFMEGLAAVPEWVPAGNHLLKSTSTVQKIRYEPHAITFRTFDQQAAVVLRLASKPKSVTVAGTVLHPPKEPDGDGYVWKPLEKGGVLKLKYTNGQSVSINL